MRRFSPAPPPTAKAPRARPAGRRAGLRRPRRRGGRGAGRAAAAGGHASRRPSGANSSTACSSPARSLPREEAQVAARIDGLSIVELDAEDGDRVEAGQVLARLDRTQLDALLAENDAAIQRADAAIEQAKSLIAQAEAQVAMDDRRLRRGRRSSAPASCRASTIEQRQTALKTRAGPVRRRATTRSASPRPTARAATPSGRNSRCGIDAHGGEGARSPGSSAAARPGSARPSSSAGEPLFRIIVDGAIDLEADAPEQSLARFAVGMPATLRLPGVADPVAGRVRLISAGSRQGEPHRQGAHRARPTCRTPISAPSPPARSNSRAATASARPPPRCGATATRRASMSCATGGSRSGKVTPGIVEGDEVEIKDGLAEGESVVARAAAFLRPGDRVRADARNDRGRRLGRRSHASQRLGLVDPPAHPGGRRLRGADDSRPRQLPDDVDHPFSQHRHSDRPGADHPVGRGAGGARIAGDEEGRGRGREPQRRLAHHLDGHRRRRPRPSSSSTSARSTSTARSTT